MNFKLSTILITTAVFTLLTSCQNNTEKTMEITPPTAKKIAEKLVAHNDVRIDNYYWLNDRENQEVIDYLNAENEYYEKITSHTGKLKEDLFQEMKSRIKEDDESVPYKLNGYYYLTRYEKGKDYPIYTRKKESLDAEEEVLFDVNKMAEGHAFYTLGGISVSEDNKLVSFGVDTVSRRQYTIYIK